MRWVRPDFTTPAKASAFFSRETARWSSAGTRSFTRAAVTATCTEVGNTSFEDWEALTWSLGCTSSSEPASFSARVARVASTSLVFMLEEVPEPVWNTSIGYWSSWSPAMTWSAAATMASARSCEMMPSSAFALAAAFLTCARAWMWAGSRPLPEIGKFSTARWVCAR